MEKSREKLMVIVEKDETQSDKFSTRSMKGAGASKLVETVMINSEDLKENLSIFIDNLFDIIPESTKKKSGLELTEIEISAEITAKGDLKICGTGVGIEGKGGIKFRFLKSE